MTFFKKILYIISVIPLFLIFTGCNLPSNELTIEDKAATVVAKTLTAIGPPKATSTLTATTTPSPTATLTPTIEPTFSVPMLKVNENTNCRQGPGQEFDVVYTYMAGASVEILGAYPNYWIVALKGSEPCWIWAEYTSASGSHWTVPTMTAPPFPTIAPPSVPASFSYQYQCTFNGANNDVAVDMSWSGSSNTMGYILYRDSVKIADLTPDITTYYDVSAADAGVTITYSIEAWNNGGKSAKKYISFSC